MSTLVSPTLGTSRTTVVGMMTGISMVDMVMMITGQQQDHHIPSLTITNVRIGEVISAAVGITGDHRSRAMATGTTITNLGIRVGTTAHTLPQVSGHMATVAVASRPVLTITMAAVETHMASTIIEAVGVRTMAIIMADIHLLLLMTAATTVKIRLEEETTRASIRFITTASGELVDKLVAICCAIYYVVMMCELSIYLSIYLPIPSF